MIVHRIAKTEKRAKDLSGTGSYNYGGRWNSKGTYMLYTCENSSLAYLENLAHQDESELPPHLYIMKIQVEDQARIYIVPDSEYPSGWQKLENIQNKLLGDSWMKKQEYLGFKVRSAINPTEFNYLFNPLLPRFYDMVTVISVSALDVDIRLIKN